MHFSETTYFNYRRTLITVPMRGAFISEGVLRFIGLCILLGGLSYIRWLQHPFKPFSVCNRLLGDNHSDHMYRLITRKPLVDTIRRRAGVQGASPSKRRLIE